MTRIHWIFAIFLGIFPLAARAQQADAGALLPLNDTQPISRPSRCESANASRPPAISAVDSTGQTMNRNVCQPSAPRSCEASISDGDDRRRRASTLL